MIRIGLRNDRSAFEPGEEISGAVLWELKEAPETAELRLVWSTRGKGSEDAETVQTITFDQPQAGDTRPFSLVLPEAPYSLNGRLIAIMWALELVLKPSQDFVREDITIGPGGKEVRLTQVGIPKEFGGKKVNPA